MKLVKARFKLVGIGCITELWRSIYSEGYALNWDEDSKLLFAAENGIDPIELDKIIAFAVEKGIFDKRLLVEKSVLTSHGIQSRWKEIVRISKRKNCEIDTEIDLLTINSGKTPEENENTPEENAKTHGEKQQSKVKESKVNKEFAAPVETTVVEKPVDKMPNFDPDIPTLKTPDGVKFAPEELAELVAQAGPDAQAHLDKFARKIAMHRYGYKNHWAALKDFWANAGGAKAWLSPRESPQPVTPSFVPDVSQSATTLQRLERYRQEAASTEDIERFETFVVGFRS